METPVTLIGIYLGISSIIFFSSYGLLSLIRDLLKTEDELVEVQYGEWEDQYGNIDKSIYMVYHNFETGKYTLKCSGYNKYEHSIYAEMVKRVYNLNNGKG